MFSLYFFYLPKAPLWVESLLFGVLHSQRIWESPWTSQDFKIAFLKGTASRACQNLRGPIKRNYQVVIWMKSWLFSRHLVGRLQTLKTLQHICFVWWTYVKSPYKKKGTRFKNLMFFSELLFSVYFATSFFLSPKKPGARNSPSAISARSWSN